MAATAAVAVCATLAACSSGRGATGSGTSVSSTTVQTPATSPSPAPTSPAQAATWNGTLSGSDQMMIGTDHAYSCEIHVICSGDPAVPTATLTTTEGWVARTTSPASGFGPSEVTLTSPSGAAVNWRASTQQGPEHRDVQHDVQPR